MKIVLLLFCLLMSLPQSYAAGGGGSSAAHDSGQATAKKRARTPAPAEVAPASAALLPTAVPEEEEYDFEYSHDIAALPDYGDVTGDGDSGRKERKKARAHKRAGNLDTVGADHTDLTSSQATAKGAHTKSSKKKNGQDINARWDNTYISGTNLWKCPYCETYKNSKEFCLKHINSFHVCTESGCEDLFINKERHYAIKHPKKSLPSKNYRSISKVQGSKYPKFQKDSQAFDKEIAKECIYCECCKLPCQEEWAVGRHLNVSPHCFAHYKANDIEMPPATVLDQPDTRRYLDEPGDGDGDSESGAVDGGPERAPAEFDDPAAMLLTVGADTGNSDEFEQEDDEDAAAATLLKLKSNPGGAALTEEWAVGRHFNVSHHCFAHYKADEPGDGDGDSESGAVDGGPERAPAEFDDPAAILLTVSADAGNSGEFEQEDDDGEEDAAAATLLKLKSNPGGAAPTEDQYRLLFSRDERGKDGELLFTCRVCKKDGRKQRGIAGFAHAKRHANLHFDYNPEQCLLCLFSAASPGTLKKHYDTRHNDDNVTNPIPTICPYCSEAIESSHNLIKHCEISPDCEKHFIANRGPALLAQKHDKKNFKKIDHASLESYLKGQEKISSEGSGSGAGRRKNKSARKRKPAASKAGVPDRDDSHRTYDQDGPASTYDGGGGSGAAASTEEPMPICQSCYTNIDDDEIDSLNLKLLARGEEALCEWQDHTHKKAKP